MSPTILASDSPKAIKEHECQCCWRTIRPGERYNRQRNVYDGTAYTFKACAHCIAFERLTGIGDWCDNNGYGADEFACYDPANVTELRWKVQYRRKWTRIDGTLYPVPGSGAAS
jgi:hypothetical protein